jgi:hypothetical protein
MRIYLDDDSVSRQLRNLLRKLAMKCRFQPTKAVPVRPIQST